MGIRYKAVVLGVLDLGAASKPRKGPSRKGCRRRNGQGKRDHDSTHCVKMEAGNVG